MGSKFNILIAAAIFFGSVAPRAAAEKASHSMNVVADSRNQLIKLNETGIVPRVLKMRKDESIVFLYNNTQEALITLEIDYGKKETHCASKSLEIGSDGIIRSIRPVAPRDFASICFHETGTYPFKVYGLSTNSRVLQGSIIVE